MNEQYPPDDRKKGNLWVLRFIKLTYRVDLALELGPQAALLLQYIALGEDRCDFLKPPRYFAKELMTACGVKDDEAFKKTRDRCVEAGWMFYQAGNFKQAGTFWVTVPDVFQALMDVRSSSGKTGSSPDHDRIMTGSSPDHDRLMTGRRPVDDRHLSPLSPFPCPRVCVEKKKTTPTPGDDKSKNTEALKRTLRRNGLGSGRESVTEWSDLLQGACGCKTLEESLWAIGWLMAAGRDAGKAITYSKHAGQFAARCHRALRDHRDNEPTKGSPCS